MWPIAIVNWVRIALRNRLFDLRIWKSVAFEAPIIFVDTLTRQQALGVSIYIQNLLKAALHIRRDLAARHQLTPQKKEPYLYLQNYSESIFSTNHKVLGLSEWYQHFVGTSAIVMNNEFTQNEIRPQLKVLVTDYEFPFYNDCLWPVGNLQGTKPEIRTTDVILVCSTPENADLKKWNEELQLYLAKEIPSYFVKNSLTSLNSFNSHDKIEFIKDRDNFERSILNVLPNANPDSE